MSGSGTISGGSASFFTSWTPTAAGTYYWRGVYAGDGNNNGFTDLGGVTEQIVINSTTPTLLTTPGPGGTVPATLQDSATLSNAYNPTGSIVFNLYPPADTSCTGTPAHTETVALSGNSASTVAGYLANIAGVWHWTASYAGDTNNSAASSGCTAEPVTVNKASPSIVTAATNTTGPSMTVSDSATLSGGYNPTGSITFKLYGPSATPVCTNLVFTSSPVTVNGNGTYGPVSFSPAATGSYYWIASYSGDTNNSAVSGACGDTNETSTVSPGLAKVVKTVSGQPPATGQTFTFELRQGASTTSDGTTLETADHGC